MFFKNGRQFFAMRVQVLACLLERVFTQRLAVGLAENVGEKYFLVTAIRLHQYQVSHGVTCIVFFKASLHA